MAVRRSGLRRPPAAVVVGVLACLLLDQVLKVYAVRTFGVGEFREVLPGVLSLGLIYNTGAAWSLFSGAALFLAVLRLLVGVGLVVYLARQSVPPLRAAALTLIAGGALGNALDGFRLGHVVDPLLSHTLSGLTRALGQGDFPIFNLADVWVVSGVALLLITGLIPPRTNGPPPEPPDGA